MKQSNKLLNVLNLILLFFILILGEITDLVFEKYCNLIKILCYAIFSVVNIVIGIKNIKEKNKIIGILNLIIALSLFQPIVHKLIDVLELFDYPEILDNLGIVFLIIVPILSIFNLFFNRKTKGNEKKKYKTTAFIIILLIEIIAILVPTVIKKIDTNNLEEAIQVLKSQSDSCRIIYEREEGKENYCDFYDEEGNLISSNNYEVILKNNINDSLKIYIIKENNKLWIIDYNGKKIARVYNLFEKKDGSDAFNHLLVKLGYGYIGDGSKDIIYLLSLQQQTNNREYVFGEFSKSDYKIIVDIDVNQLETDTGFFEKYGEYLDNGFSFLSDEEIEEIKSLYKYKKKYYLINKNNQKIELNCNNIAFTIHDSNLAIWVNSNGYLPYYDKENTGYFNYEGQKFSLSTKYSIYDTTEKYQIIYDKESDEYYIMTYDNQKMIDDKIISIEYYDNDILITGSNVYLIKNNQFIKLSNNKKRYNGCTLINMYNYIENKSVPYKIGF